MAKKIMVVDDEDNIRILVKELLEDAGYEVVSVASGKEALTLLNKHIVDLVLIDYYMPNFDGKQLCFELRQKWSSKELKIIFLTVAQFGKDDLVEIKNLGVLDYIQKPFDNDDLLRRIKHFIG
jgi:DNA-binding response OmpR family regulator